jgi:hypothetical protein
MAADIEVIWVRRKQEYFCERGWTPKSPNGPPGKSGGGPFEEVGAMCCIYPVREPTGADS